MIVNKVSLATVAVKPEQYPEDDKPEIAFTGKSNVGKSSLINTMINRKALARTSRSPGKTRTINFYNIEDTLYFVDLPGYGYAKVSHSESQKWGSMIEKYLLKRPQLKAIVMLLDIRHEPGANDKTMLEWLKYYDYPLIIAATKADKIKRSQLQKQVSVIRKSINSPKSQIIPFSSEDFMGRDTLWEAIEQLIR